MKIKQVQTLSKMLVILAFLSPFLPLKSKDIIWYDGNHAVSYFVQTSTDPVVKIALDMFEGDIKSVTGKKAIKRLQTFVSSSWTKHQSHSNSAW